MAIEYVDLFLEVKLPTERHYLQASDLGLDVYLASINRRSLSNGRSFVMVRFRKGDTETVLSKVRSSDAEVLGWSWREVWNTYPQRDEVFTAQEDGKSYPYGVFAGDEVEAFSTESDPLIQSVSATVAKLRAAVAADNELTEADKSKIEGYLKAIEAIAGQRDPDIDAIKYLATRLRGYLTKVTMRIGEKLVVDKVLEGLDYILSLIF